MQERVTINERGVITIPAALRRAFGLKAGEVILSGSQSPLIPVKAGDSLSCSVGGLGSTSVRFI